MNKFWELFEKNVIISGTLALMLVGSVCYLTCTGQAVPDILALSTGTVMGYFFGAGKASAVVRTFKAPAKAEEDPCGSI